jgi:hypothetical protein
MGVFEYLGVLTSVIMGLGITHLATGATKLIQNRDKVTFYLPHALWTVNILVQILLIWWGMFWWSNHTEWYAYQYLFITGYAIVLYFLASMLYPWDMEKDINVREYFLQNKVWFYGAFIVAWTIDIPETLTKANVDLRPVPPEYFVFIALNILIASVGMATRKIVIQTALPIAWFAMTLYYVSMTLLGQIRA